MKALRTGLVLVTLGLLAPLPVAAAAPVPASDPTLEEMVEALSVKPAPADPGAARGLRAPASRAAPREGTLQLAVQFDYASATISPASREVLRRLAAAMKSPALAGLEYRIEGHTDATGDGAANMRLSDRRARAVLEFLQAASGVDASRLTALGMGSARPADPSDPKAAVNRRVVVVSMVPLVAAAAPAAPAAPATPPSPPPPATAAAPRDGAGTVERLKGELKVLRGPSSSVLHAGSRVREGDVLVTGADATGLVRLDDGSYLLLRPDSTLKVVRLKLAGDPSTWGQVLELAVGAFRYVTGSLGGNRPSAISLRTATATVGIRGTDLDIVHKAQPGDWGDAGTYVKVNRGGVAVGGVDGSRVELGAAEQAFAGPKKPTMRGAKAEPAAMRLQAPADVFATGELDALVDLRN